MHKCAYYVCTSCVRDCGSFRIEHRKYYATKGDKMYKPMGTQKAYVTSVLRNSIGANILR